MKVISICGCVSFETNPKPYQYTYPIRPHNVGMVDIQKHEFLCEKALSIKDEILEHQSLDGPYPCD